MFLADVVVRLFLLFGLFYLLSFLENSAAMRGTRGEDSLPPFKKKVLRGIFLGVLLLPLLSFSSLLYFLVFFAYLHSYSDLSELNGGRPSSWMKKWIIWKWIRNYFYLDLVKTVPLKETDKYLFAIHPHGILPFGSMINILSDCNNLSELIGKIQVRTLVASFCFYIPIYREILLGGGVCDASRFSAHKLLQKGFSLALVPGGATEALYTDPDVDILYLKSRKGFMKLAMQHGCKVVPVFSFNECLTFSQFSIHNRPVQWMKKKFQAIFGISLPILKNIIPRRARITTVIGRPVEVPFLEDPSDEQVQEALELYIKEVERMYLEEGPKYNINKEKKLKIV